MGSWEAAAELGAALAPLGSSSLAAQHLWLGSVLQESSVSCSCKGSRSLSVPGERLWVWSITCCHQGN